MDKPTKPTNLMPRSFGGIKNNWSASMQSSGYEDGVPAIYGGDNLNYQLDATGKELDYCEKFCDFINAMPIGKTITVDANNKLVYRNNGADTSLSNLTSDGKARIAIKQYLSTETYALDDVVMAIVDDEVSLFKSLVANNVGNAITDDTYWEEVELGGGSDLNLYTTNCITEIPQDIKLELNNGTLTLKAGSKVYVPNGFNGTTPKFDEVVIQNDVNIVQSTNNTWYLCYTPNTGFDVRVVGNTDSGTNPPSVSSIYRGWYDTTNNLMKFSSDSGSTWTSGYSLPIAIVTSSNDNGYTSIDQVFNGFGYIGSTIFALKGVKGLMPDGRNEDGTLRNKEFELTRTCVNTRTWNSTIPQCVCLHFDNYSYIGSYNHYIISENEPSYTHTIWYNPITNLISYRGASGDFKVADYTSPIFTILSDGTSKIVGIKDVQQALRVVNYSDLSEVHTVVDTYVNGSSGYRIWSDGWCEQWGRGYGGSGAFNTITFLKPFLDANYNITSSITNDADNNNSSWVKFANYTTTSVQTRTGYNTTAANQTFCWKAEGYVA